MEHIEFEGRLSEEITSLKTFAKHFTQDIEDSNDLVQETLFKALRFWNSFKEGTNFKGWLYTIMRNTFINSYRFKIMSRSEITQVDDLSSAQLFIVSARNLAESKITMDDIKSALNQLGKNYHIPFTMYYQGYKYHEIAEYLSVPIGTVKNRIHLARKALKKILEPYHFYRATA